MNLELKLSEEKALSAEIQCLQEEARMHLENSKSPNTKSAYHTDWNQFLEWCAQNEFSSLPAAPQTVVFYITYLGKNRKASTIRRKMTSISQRHETAGYPSPTKSPLVKGVWNGLQRSIGIKEVGKEVIWLYELQKIVEAIPTDTSIGVRNRTILVLGWAGALRRSEIVGIDAEHIVFSYDGVIISIGKSKTDQKGQGQEIALPFGSNPLTCPVRNLKRWLEVSGITTGPVFRRIDRHGNLLNRLTPQSVRLVVKKSCSGVGLDAEKYGAHSLRSGFCSTAAKAGKSEHQIMRQTRHRRSDSLQRYIKKGTLFEENAASGIGL